MPPSNTHPIWPSEGGIADLSPEDRAIDCGAAMAALAGAWEGQQRLMQEAGMLRDFVQRVQREWALEAGLGARLYYIAKEVSARLVQQGFDIGLLPPGATDLPPDLALRLLRDQQAALQMVRRWYVGVGAGSPGAELLSAGPPAPSHVAPSHLAPSPPAPSPPAPSHLADGPSAASLLADESLAPSPLEDGPPAAAGPMSAQRICQLHALLTRHQPELGGGLGGNSGSALGGNPGGVSRGQPSGASVGGESGDGGLRAGQWKAEPNYVVRRRGLGMFCPPERVEDQVQRLLALHAEHQQQGVPAPVCAAWLHHRFAQIHPFADGNGRVGLALACAVLLSEGGLPFGVPRDDWNWYIRCLEAGDRGDLGPLVDLMMHQQQRLLAWAESMTLPLYQGREGAGEGSQGGAGESEGGQDGAGVGKGGEEAVGEEAVGVGAGALPWHQGRGGGPDILHDADGDLAGDLAEDLAEHLAQDLDEGGDPWV